MSSIHEKVRLLEEQLQYTTNAEAKVDLLNSMAFELRHINSAVSIKKSNEATELAEQIGYRKGIADAMLNRGFGEMTRADYTSALQTLHKAIGIFEEMGNEPGKGNAQYTIGIVYSRIGENNAALDALSQSLVIRRGAGDQKGEAACLLQLGYIFFQFGNFDQSADYYQQCLTIQRQIDDNPGLAIALMALALVEQKKEQYAAAETHLLESLRIRQELGETNGWLMSMNYIGELYLQQNRLEEAARCLDEAIEKAEQQVPPFPANSCHLYTARAKVTARNGHFTQAVQYLEKALQQAEAHNLKYQLHDIYKALAEVYKQKEDYPNALASYEKYHQAKEEVINLTASTKLKNLELANQIEDERKRAEIHRLRNIELKHAYDQLEAAQAQLIQKEKMASLGELTAGIAHEIQNPLNFVNNFSEINADLVEELKHEAGNGSTQQVMQIADAIKNNEQKILHHGKRAEAIVKSMLQHSRLSTGDKEFTDLNALTDEYLRLSFHGFRAKDKAFHSEVETCFDNTIGQVAVVPQDIGRVLLNLFSNAFYAVSEKKSKLDGAFEPMVSVSTRREGNNVIIAVKDNGTGMPPKVAEKVFQPFFTTKPTGEGTGLGLSLSYDIVTKAHGGELKVESKEGEGTVFTLLIPVVTIENNQAL